MASEAQQVMLAEKWDGEDVTGWWISEKLDGIRAYYSKGRFYSRLGNEFFPPKWFTKGLPDEALDGELFAGHRQFRKCSSIVKRHDQSDDWKYITYFVFDAPKVPGGFEQRMAFVNDNVRPDKTPHAVAVGMRKCNGKDHVLSQLKIVEDAGGEGLMLRKPNSAYVHSRTNVLLKVKNFVDEEAVVIAHEKGQGRNQHRMGALVCRTPDGREFNVGSGFTDKERDHPPKIGSVITYKYQELTEKSNKPRFPTFVGVRHDIDWKDYCKTYKSPIDDLPSMPALKAKHSLLFNTYGEVLDRFKDGSSGAASSSSSASASATSSAAAGAKKRNRDDSGSDTDAEGDDPSDDRPPCKYGASCYRRNKAHTDEFYHPPPPKAAKAAPAATNSKDKDKDEEPAPKKSKATADDEPTRALPSFFRVNSANIVDDDDDDSRMDASTAAAAAKMPPALASAATFVVAPTPSAAAATSSAGPTPVPTPSPVAPVASPAPGDASKKPVCRFGSKCYRKNPAHFKDFAHNDDTVTGDDD